ncbi:MAG TPA: response regulator [Burkholderiaceae bacterium]|nr:response regulator [Burkholderiaceae bacterium]
MKKVLVVDDQYPIRRMVRWSVEHAGFEMHEASNGEQGLALALTLRPSLLLLDVMMPGRFDGLEVCRQLRARPEMAQTWIVMLSGNDAPQDREKGKQVGANAYLAKPFKPAQLSNLIEKLVNGGPPPPFTPADRPTASASDANTPGASAEPA